MYKPGDIWTCPACGVEVVCNEWGVRHNATGHNIGISYQSLNKEGAGIPLQTDKKAEHQNKGGQGTLF